MANRPSWSGFLKLSLVACPVELYSAATREHTISFHFIHPKTHNRINMKPYDPDLGLVERKDLVRGYEIEKGQYVTVTDEDLEKIRIESTHTIDVNKFVGESDIDPVYLDAHYFLMPKGAMAVEAYSVIREAMRREKKIALGRLVLSHRERTVAIQPHGRALLLTRLKDQREVEARDFSNEVPETKVDKEMVEIATRIVEQASGKFDPKEYEDHYEVALCDLIRKRAKGKRPMVVGEPEAPRATNVIDLMATLKKSLETQRGRPEGGEPGGGKVVHFKGGKGPARKAPKKRRASPSKSTPRRKKA